MHDHFCILRQFTVPGACIHDNVGICVVTTKSFCQDELLRTLELPSSVFTVGTVRLLCIAWQYDMGRSCRNGGRTYLLFCGGCISPVKRRFSNSENSANTEDFV